MEALVLIKLVFPKIILLPKKKADCNNDLLFTYECSWFKRMDAVDSLQQTRNNGSLDSVPITFLVTLSISFQSGGEIKL